MLIQETIICCFCIHVNGQGIAYLPVYIYIMPSSMDIMICYQLYSQIINTSEFGFGTNHKVLEHFYQIDSVYLYKCKEIF